MEINKNELLQKLADHARSMNGFGTDKLIPEKFLAAVAELQMDRTPFRLDEREKNIISSVLRRIVDDDDLRGFAVRLRIISSKNPSGVGSQEDMEAYLEEADMMFEDKLIALSKVLRNIIENPSKNIKNFFMADEENEDVSEEKQQKESEEENEQEPDPMDEWDFADIPGFDDEDLVELDYEQSGRKRVEEFTEESKKLQNTLRELIIGQDHAVNVFASGYFKAQMLSITDSERSRPKAIFLFAGPPGVGKTFLAETAAKTLGLPFKRFDMSEYADKESTLTFSGSDKVYKNGKEGTVTSFVKNNPECILLFDEIEKAHLNIIHLFLQLLDAGRLRDTYSDEEVSFKNAIIIFTTNAGRKLYEDTDQIDFSGVTRKVILKALQSDINPVTKDPMFPTAICSRFATGNVVMFNHMTASSLWYIARRELLRHAGNLEERSGIEFDIDENVYTALMFSEGGTADARNIRSKAESFFEEQLFELFRLVGSERVKGSVSGIKKINIRVELPENDRKIRSLFAAEKKPDILLFASDETGDECRDIIKNCSIMVCSDVKKAREHLENGPDIAVIDWKCGMKGSSNYLNIEDEDSAARDMMWLIKENYPDIPIYLLQREDQPFKDEEISSFIGMGVRDILTLGGDKESFVSALDDITVFIHRQKSMISLAQSNKLISFETAQTLSDDGTEAGIKLFDFEMSVAVDAEDSGNILSGVSRPDIRFDQVIGANDAKKELRYFVEYMKDPKRFIASGVSAPRGILLYGPPGTGKTMLAKAMAGECDVTYIAAEGNQFLKKFVGEGSEKVHQLFRIARKYAPSILFIDEIDAIARSRTGEGHGEDTLTTFLTEMDGFRSDPRKPVFVLAATNFTPEPGTAKSLDPALMRRFDRRIYIDLPTRDDRTSYLNMMVKNKPALHLSEEKIKSIAVRSTGMSLAQLQSVIELSLRTALRDGKPEVSDEIFDEAFEVFNSGEEEHWDDSTIERVARHESGHAFLCWLSGEVPSYLTIVARGDHGGYMQHDDNSQKHILTRKDLRDKIRTSLGGRAAEIVYYGPEDGISSGASGDLAQATDIAKRLICSYGMDDGLGLAVISPSEMNGELSTEVRRAVNKILSAEMAKAVKLISENRRAIDALVERLITDNHLSGTEIDDLLKANMEQ